MQWEGESRRQDDRLGRVWSGSGAKEQLLQIGGVHILRLHRVVDNQLFRAEREQETLIFCNPSTALDQPTQSQIGFGDRPKYKHLLLQHL